MNPLYVPKRGHQLQTRINQHFFDECFTCGVRMVKGGLGSNNPRTRTRGHLIPISFVGRKRWHAPQCRQCNDDQGHQTIIQWGLLMKGTDPRFERVMDSIKILNSMGVTFKEMGADK